MRYILTPALFQQIALCFNSYRWKLIGWSLLLFILYVILELNIGQTTPDFLVWFALAILFFSLQILVFSAFIFFFQNLTSTKTMTIYWKTFYQIVEWCEAVIFTILLPCPAIIFLYAIVTISK